MERLVAYIQKELQKGFSEELIRKKLQTAGYSSDEITNAFHDFETKQHYHDFVGTFAEDERKHTWLVIVATVIFIIIIIIVATAFAPHIEWAKVTELFQVHKTIEPITEQDCNNLEFKQYEQCLLKLAGTNKNTMYCTNITSKVMKYECRTAVWDKNYCNYLLLTGQDTTSC